jgi:diguanylate cyclase (GGDEF)-like protein
VAYGLGPILVFIGLVELLRHPPGLEPAAVIPVLVLLATIIGGFLIGWLAAAVGIAYAAVYYLSTPLTTLPGGIIRLVLTMAAAAVVVWAAARLRESRTQAATSANRHEVRSSNVQEFTRALANEPEDTLPQAVVAKVADLLQTDTAVLTVLDPHTGRQHVRAIRGGGASALGVEVIPGVGVTGQALRERRLVLASSNGSEPGPHHVAAVPATQAGRVLATITCGRTDPRRPFSADDVATLELIAPVLTLAISGSLNRAEVAQGSPRDAHTGLYNRAYLDATLGQIIALRRRTPPADRSPMSMILFDIDSFRLLNERHGRPVGDAVLRAVATLLRQRFRASDVLARVGPDSFCALLDGATSEVAAEAAAHVRRQVRELNLSNGRGEPVVVSISAGCAMFRDGEPRDGLFRSVEAALDTARWSGPGAVVSI